MIRILIGVMSCQSYAERRRRCLESWVPDAMALGIDVVFLIGGSSSEAVRDGMTLHLPCIDDYSSLPQKTCQFVQWAIDNSDCDYIFKCDDDTYLRADRLAAFETNGRDYIGAEWSPGAGYASGGAGYWLSRQSMMIVASELKQYLDGAEDVLVGQCLAGADIPLHIDERFIAFGNAELRPRRNNSIISTHGCDAPWKSHLAEFCCQRPVVSCVPAGRLGNNMFQVAAALGFASRYQTHDPIFQIGTFGRYGSTMFSRLKYSNLPTEHMTIHDAPDFAFNEQIAEYPFCSVVFNGFMQSEKYFAHCRDLIQQTFAISAAVKAELYTRFRKELLSGAVSLHVRRGDYLSRPEFHPVQSIEYYRSAIQYLTDRVSVGCIFCLSDDPDWCRQNLLPADQRILLVEGQDDYSDLALMTLCQHHIIANSSFSWWGAWLGKNPEKIVVAPKTYLGPAFAGYSERDLIPKDWIRIGSDGSIQQQNASRPQQGIHANGYWLSDIAGHHHAFDEGLSDELCRFFIAENASVVDLGCGPGLYVKALRNMGVVCAGFDGNPWTEILTDGQCGVLDLSVPLKMEESFDWVLSLEVGEHIPQIFEAVFVENLHRCNRKGIILSWAVPGQGGYGHLNERPNLYIREIFRKWGYVEDPRLERSLRQSVTDCSWFRNTIMVFRRDLPHFPHGITMSQIRLLIDKDDPVVLELGCNDGTDSIRFLDEFPGITLHCFEPDPRPLMRFCIRDSRCFLHRIAIARNDGTAVLHQCGGHPPDQRMDDWDLSSSIHLPTGHLQAHPWCTFEKKTFVQVRSLDSWYLQYLSPEPIDFIWADIQGAEGDLIRGGRRTLCDHTKYLYTECYESPMYEGQPTRREILEMLPEFECIGVFEGYNILLKNRKLNKAD